MIAHLHFNFSQSGDFESTAKKTSKKKKATPAKKTPGRGKPRKVALEEEEEEEEVDRDVPPPPSSPPSATPLLQRSKSLTDYGSIDLSSDAKTEDGRWVWSPVN